MNAARSDYIARLIFTPWLAGILFFALAVGQLSGGLRARSTLLASLVIAVFFGGVAGCRFNSNERKLVAGLFAASVLLQALPEIVHPRAFSLYEFAWRASLVVLGWC